jgi:hypothetical protein
LEPTVAVSELGAEATRLNEKLTAKIDPETLYKVWDAARSILDRGPIHSGEYGSTGLALGYVQSGKTTSITALIAHAADSGYQVIIALLGTTNILLDQNRRRIENALGIPERNDFKWVVEVNPSGTKAAGRMSDWVERGRTVFIPMLKHAGRINRLKDVLARSDLRNEPVLIIDDEGDQASLNTETSSGTNRLSRTYEAITNLRGVVPENLFVQFTATPYAPLLIDPDDHLLPSFVEFLHPGPSYTGGREFFVDHAEKVVRDVPSLEEQTGQLPIELPGSLVDALGSFVAGAALLLTHDSSSTPVSMLVHSTHRNDIQARYHFLIGRKVRQWREETLDASIPDHLPAVILAERRRLVGLGAEDVSDEDFVEKVLLVLREIVLWLVNSAVSGNRVDWLVAPVHILVGGNKLDRGFTIEGLTVTYMNRKPSDQIDTLEQRARAFGYRADQLPYCQFFASKRTVKILRDVVFTEYDLRAQLEDHIAAGGTVAGWAEQLGLLLPAGTKPTRTTVVRALSTVTPGWHSLRRPSLESIDVAKNRDLVSNLGLFDAPPRDYGRLSHRTIFLPLEEVVERLVSPWAISSYSPDWRKDEIVSLLRVMRKHPEGSIEVPVVLLDEGGNPRIRQWEQDTGFVNLFQGRDVTRVPGRPFYPGDRDLVDLGDDRDRIVVQVHRLVRRVGTEILGPELLTLAAHLGNRPIVRGRPVVRDEENPNHA